MFDFVGTDATMRLALAAAATLGTVAIVGAGGGTVSVGWGALPSSASCGSRWARPSPTCAR